MGYMARACFSTILQVISYSWCIGRETNQFPSTALSSDCQIFFFSLLSTIPPIWGGAFPYSSLLTFYIFFLFLSEQNERKVNPLKVKRQNTQRYLLNKVQHLGTLLLFLCHTAGLSSETLGSVRLMMLVCAGMGRETCQMPEES